MPIRDDTIFWYAKMYYAKFVLYCYTDNHGIYLLAIAIFWVFAIVFIARVYRKAKRRTYIGTSIFELNKVPLYLELTRIKEREKQAKIKNESIRHMYELELQSERRRAKERLETNQLLIEDEALYELRYGKAMPTRTKIANWFRRVFNDDAIRSHLKKKPKKEVVIEHTKADEPLSEKLSAWDKYPPTYADLPIHELNIVAGRNELNFYKLIKERNNG